MFVFLAAGALISWWTKEVMLSVVLAMALGSTSLALEMAISLPWFQFMVSHPTIYDYVFVFLGAMAPPMAGGCGAYIHYRLQNCQNRENAT